MMAMLQMNNQTVSHLFSLLPSVRLDQGHCIARCLQGFDMIWGWVKLHMLHTDPSDQLYGWSAWHAWPNGTRISDGPAPDGETWFITTLFGAAARWGDGASASAVSVTSAMNHTVLHCAAYRYGESRLQLHDGR
jgi:endo-1,4-beta-D-glucanase Y